MALGARCARTPRSLGFWRMAPSILRRWPPRAWAAPLGVRPPSYLGAVAFSMLLSDHGGRPRTSNRDPRRRLVTLQRLSGTSPVGVAPARGASSLERRQAVRALQVARLGSLSVRPARLPPSDPRTLPGLELNFARLVAPRRFEPAAVARGTWRPIPRATPFYSVALGARCFRSRAEAPSSTSRLGTRPR